MAKTVDNSDLRNTIRKLFDVCRARGIKFPWLITAVAINGSVLALRVTSAREGKGIKVETLAEQHVDDAMVLPIHFLVVDGKGEAHLASITKAKVTFH